MLKFQQNRLFAFIGILLLICLSAAGLHFLAHAAQHGNDFSNTDHCAVCQFVTVIGSVLFCVVILFLRLQQTQFEFLETEKLLPFKNLSAASGRAPPFSLS